MLVLQNIYMQELHNNADPFIFFIICGILLLIGAARQLEGDRLSLFLRSFINGNLADQQLRQERAFSRIAMIAFFIVISSISLFGALSIHTFGLLLDFSFIGLFAVIFILLFLFTTLRVAVYAFFAWLFHLEKLQQHHSYHWLLVNLIGSFILIPISIGINYGPIDSKLTLALFGIALLAIINLIRIVRLFIVSSTAYSVPITYNFLYICALEILPLWVSTAVVLRQIGG